MARDVLDFDAAKPPQKRSVGRDAERPMISCQIMMLRDASTRARRGPFVPVSTTPSPTAPCTTTSVLTLRQARSASEGHVHDMRVGAPRPYIGTCSGKTKLISGPSWRFGEKVLRNEVLSQDECRFVPKREGTFLIKCLQRKRTKENVRRRYCTCTLCARNPPAGLRTLATTEVKAKPVVSWSTIVLLEPGRLGSAYQA